MEKRILVVMIIQFFVYLGFGIIIPVIPEIIVNLSNNSIHLGGLLSVYSLVSFITAPLWGHMSDKYGRKKLILVGLIGYAISFICFGTMTNNLIGLYVSRIMGGFFSGALYSASISYVVDISREEDRTKNMGLIGISIGLGFILGPSIGGFISEFGYATPFYSSAIVLSCLLLYVWMYLPEVNSFIDTPRYDRFNLEKVKMLLNNKKLAYLLFFTVFTSLIMAGLESTFQLFEMENIGITPKQIGVLFFISGIFDALVQGGIVPLIKSTQEPRWIVGGQIFCGFSLCLIPLTQELWIAAVALALFSGGNALVRTCTLSLITKQAGQQQGIAAGVSYSMDSLGRIIGPLAFTLILGINSLATFILLSMLSFFSIVLISMFNRLHVTTSEI